VIFGFTEAQISAFGLSFGLAAFMLYMVFIIAQLAWESKAGKMVCFVPGARIWHARVCGETCHPMGADQSIKKGRPK
jgi:hypothetical protein